MRVNGSHETLDSAVMPRGYRLLHKIPRLPVGIINRLVSHFGSLQHLLAASAEDLMTVEGVGELRARSVREGRSEEHTSELQSRGHLVCRLLLEKKKKKQNTRGTPPHRRQMKDVNDASGSSIE